MSILCWNVRGVNKGVRRCDVCDFIQKYSLFIVVLVDTKVKLKYSQRIISCIPPGWGSTHNSLVSDTGRIWIFWNQQVWSCTELSNTKQQISLLALNQAGLQIVVSFVYRENWESLGKSLRSDLCSMHDTHGHLPYMVLGDFNVARYTDEKVGRKPLSIQKLKDFNECISYCS